MQKLYKVCAKMLLILLIKQQVRRSSNNKSCSYGSNDPTNSVKEVRIQAPLTHNIWAMTTTIRGKIIRPALCCTVYHNCVFT